MNLHELEAEYEILGELGRGGTAIVYRARDRELGRDVAIKVVRSIHADDQEAVARLAREAKLVATLRHPNIVPLLGIRHLSDGLALIMQHVPGKTLKAAIREHGPMPIAVVEHVLREIGSALDYAHKRHNVIHRDIKPENIYLDEEIERALLSDFGIARVTDSDSSLTLVGTALGTPTYMSPEQIDGITLDGRSDLYSLGLVAYEMLSGQQPWAGSNLYTIIYKQKNEELPPLSSVRSDVPDFVARIVERLLKKDPAARYADAAEMIAEMPNVASGITLPPPSKPVAPITAVVYDDAPTISYQRPTFTIVEPGTEAIDAPMPAPEPEPQSEAQPSVTTPAEVAAVAALFAELPPELDPPVEVALAPTGWRLKRHRFAIPHAPAEVTAEPAVALAEAEVVTVSSGISDRMRIVAGLTVMLMLGGAATVVAMRDGKSDADDRAVASAPQVQDVGSASFVKASSTSLTSSPSIPNSTPAIKTQQRDTITSGVTEAASAETTPVPQLSVPEIDLGSSGRRVSEADFSRISAAPQRNAEENIRDVPTFTPHTVKPELRNRDVVQRALSEYYPPVLRERKIGGTVNLWILVDSTGKVLRSRVDKTSGNEYLDEAAAKVADAMQFTPALNRDKKVSVWLKLPIIFKTR